MIEIHTGGWCDAVVDGHKDKAEAEWKRIVAGVALAHAAGLEVHAGHGLDYETAETISALPEIAELNIGYFMMGEALFVGIAGTVRRDAGGDGPRPRQDRGRRMIIGIGSDLIDITRVAKVIERHGERFLDRIFTDAERAKAVRRANNEKMVVATYAKRFAAKEACSKALGTGIRRGVVVEGHGGGEPAGGAADHAADRRRAGPAAGADAGGHRGRGSTLSITDDWPLAQAFVGISAVARRQALSRAGVCAGEA